MGLVVIGVLMIVSREFGLCQMCLLVWIHIVFVLHLGCLEAQLEEQYFEALCCFWLQPGIKGKE